MAIRYLIHPDELGTAPPVPVDQPATQLTLYVSGRFAACAFTIDDEWVSPPAAPMIDDDLGAALVVWPPAVASVQTDDDVWMPSIPVDDDYVTLAAMTVPWTPVVHTTDDIWVTPPAAFGLEDDLQLVLTQWRVQTLVTFFQGAEPPSPEAGPPLSVDEDYDTLRRMPPAPVGHVLLGDENLMPVVDDDWWSWPVVWPLASTVGVVHTATDDLGTFANFFLDEDTWSAPAPVGRWTGTIYTDDEQWAPQVAAVAVEDEAWIPTPPAASPVGRVFTDEDQLAQLGFDEELWWRATVWPPAVGSVTTDDEVLPILGIEDDPYLRPTWWPPTVGRTFGDDGDLANATNFFLDEDFWWQFVERTMTVPVVPLVATTDTEPPVPPPAPSTIRIMRDYCTQWGVNTT